MLDLYPRGYVLPDHSSLYLSLSEPNAQAADWSAHVSFSLGLLHPATKERSVWTSFSKLFSTQVHSWGKNNFYPISDSRANALAYNDTAIVVAEICVISAVSHRLEDWGTQSNGRHRFVWKIGDMQNVVQRFDVGQKLSSQEFTTEEGSMSRVWFLDMYPAGYKSNSAISLYLHASKFSASAKPVRVPFQLCVFDFHLRDFVICANLCQTFSNEQRCWGKQAFISPNELFGLTSGAADRFVKDGVVVFCVDINMTCEVGCVAKLLLFSPEATALKCKGCGQAFGFSWDKVRCRYCGDLYCANCCSKWVNIGEMGYTKPQLVCDVCVSERESHTDGDGAFIRDAQAIRFRPASAQIVPRINISDACVQAECQLTHPDDLALNCYNCKSLFGFFVRKHHCRACGKLHCSSCLTYYAPIPESGDNSQQKMCQPCFEVRSQSFDRIIVVSPKVYDAPRAYRKPSLNKRGKKKSKDKKVIYFLFSSLLAWCSLLCWIGVHTFSLSSSYRVRDWALGSAEELACCVPSCSGWGLKMKMTLQPMQRNILRIYFPMSKFVHFSLFAADRTHRAITVRLVVQAPIGKIRIMTTEETEQAMLLKLISGSIGSSSSCSNRKQ